MVNGKVWFYIRRDTSGMHCIAFRRLPNLSLTETQLTYLPHAYWRALHMGRGRRADRNHSLRGMAVRIEVVVLVVSILVVVLRGHDGRLLRLDLKARYTEALKYAHVKIG